MHINKELLEILNFYYFGVEANSSIKICETFFYVKGTIGQDYCKFLIVGQLYHLGEMYLAAAEKYVKNWQLLVYLISVF